MASPVQDTIISNTTSHRSSTYTIENNLQCNVVNIFIFIINLLCMKILYNVTLYLILHGLLFYKCKFLIIHAYKSND
jgi:hypothetical protein